MTCNGFTNSETWTVYLWYGEYLKEVFEETPDLTTDDLRNIVEEIVFVEQEHNGFIGDAINSYLNAVDWEQLWKNVLPIEEMVEV